MNTRQNSFGQTIGPVVEGWSPRPRPPRTDMVGRYCRLEPVDVDRHAAQLYTAYREAPDSRDWTYLFVDRPESPSAFQTYLAKLQQSADPLHFAIVATDTSEALGTAALMRIEPAHGV